MKVFWSCFFAVILAIAVAVLVTAGMVASKSGTNEKIEKHSYLVIDVYGDIAEYDAPSGILGIVGEKPETLQRILGNLEKAAVDDRIDGVILKISSTNSTGLAMREEMRNAVKKVRGAGKKVYCWSDSMDRNAYYLAAACDTIWLAPPANMSFLGLSSGSMYIKGTLDKIGVRPNLHQIREYKAAAELMTRTSASAPARENDEWMLNEFWDMLMKAFAEDRKLSEERVLEIMNLAVLTADQAKEKGLIDGVLYWDELERRIAGGEDEELKTVSQETYADVKPEKLGLKGSKKIAVVHAFGMIGGRESSVNPMLGVMMGHETVIADLRRAADDEDVAAIVFRVDSHGGEGLASDLIGREVEHITKEKPVVSSMVDVAASGGYYITYQATKIVADPMTITGSIGSIAMKLDAKGLYDKLGVTHDFVTRGPMALFYTDTRDFTPEERARFEQNHWDGFNMWLADVAKHRGMTFARAESLAFGRVWTGRQARENGLIDELGGLDRAIELAKELAQIPADEKVTIVHFPEKKGILQILLGGKGAGVTEAARFAVYRFIRGEVAETWRLLNEGNLYLMEDEGPR